MLTDVIDSYIILLGFIFSIVVLNLISITIRGLLGK